jgi:SAM-dependent methyltransferase
MSDFPPQPQQIEARNLVMITSAPILSPEGHRAGDVYDQIAIGEPDEDTSFLGNGYSPVLKRYLEHVKGIDTSFVIDLGTGFGRQLDLVMLNSKVVVGIDVSMESLKRAAQRAVDLRQKAKDRSLPVSQLSLWQADMTNFVDEHVVQPGQATLITSISVINHTTRGGVLDTLYQCNKALRMGGKFIFTMVSTANPQYQPDLFIDPTDYDGDQPLSGRPGSGIDGDVMHTFIRSEKELKELLDRTGFRPVPQRSTNGGPKGIYLGGKEDIGGRSEGHFIVCAEKVAEPNRIITLDEVDSLTRTLYTLAGENLANN